MEWLGIAKTNQICEKASYSTQHELAKNNAILIFNGNCPMCQDLSSLVERGSKGKVELAPFSSYRAKSLLKRFYPNGHPFSYFLVEESDGHSRIWRGSKAAIRLTRHLPISDSAKVLTRYLQYRAMRNRLNRGMTRSGCQPIVEDVAIQERRGFLHTALAGGMALMLGSISLRTLMPLS